VVNLQGTGEEMSRRKVKAEIGIYNPTRIMSALILDFYMKLREEVAQWYYRLPEPLGEPNLL
jgi:hypothetical protein